MNNKNNNSITGNKNRDRKYFKSDYSLHILQLTHESSIKLARSFFSHTVSKIVDCLSPSVTRV